MSEPDTPQDAPVSTPSPADRIKAWRWKPGQSGNPGGAPKRKRFREALEAYYEANPDRFAEVIERLDSEARLGKAPVGAAEFVRDTVDGPLETRLAGVGKDGEIEPFTITFRNHKGNVPAESEETGQASEGTEG
jgi:hypothetical protein